MSDRSASATVLTIMMTEIVGSAALRQVRGDGAGDDILGLQAEIVHDKVIAFGGRVRKSLGDGFLISFPSSVAAVSAAAAVERALHEYNLANPQRTLEIRIDDDHVGAHPDSILNAGRDRDRREPRIALERTRDRLGHERLTMNDHNRSCPHPRPPGTNASTSGIVTATADPLSSSMISVSDRDAQRDSRR